MPSVLQICVEGNVGSTGKIAEAIGQLAISKGWKSYIAHGRFSRSSKSEIIKIGNNFDVFFHGIRTRLFDQHCLGSKTVTEQLIRKINIINPDIIHLHHLHGYYINIEVLFNYLKKKSTPVIWTFHDCWSITGHCCHFDFVGCNKWKNECFACPQKKEYPSSYLFDRSRKNFLQKRVLFTSLSNITIVAVSNWLKEVVGESFMKETPTTVIYNGININSFYPNGDTNSVRDKFHVGNRYLLLGVANTWGIRKGYYDFIELSKEISEDTIIILVGLNRNQIKNLPSNIIGITRTENLNELRELYQAADIYINLSVEETFGLTTAEALACGTPAIVYNATACPEVIDEKTGIVVEKNNIKEVVNAIETIKRKGKAYYSAACRERALHKFNQTLQFEEYLKLYQNLIIRK
jgi:glycosyltransferase involved in cell wall biosynthesis